MPQIASKSLRERINAALQDGEQVVWTGQPDPDLMARRQSVAIAAGLFVALSMIPVAFKLLTGHFDQDELLIKALGVAIVVVPLFCTYCVWFWAKVAASDTIYAITNKRALIIETNKVVEFNVVTSLDVKQSSGGKSDLVFEQLPLKGRYGTYNKAMGFFCISDADNAEDILKETFEPARVRHTPARSSDTWS